jgi:hypothetical protein
MNTNGLAKLYDRLTAYERPLLIMAATERGDDAEADRLSRSAPRINVRLPDYHGLGDGLFLLSLFHMIGQLHFGLLFWQGTGIAALCDEGPVCKKFRHNTERLWNLTRMVAYRIGVQADGWKRLCDELRIGPELLLRDLQGYEEVQRSEEAARRVAFSAEEAAAFLRRSGDKAGEPQTAEQAAKAMRDFINQRAAWWG